MAYNFIITKFYLMIRHNLYVNKHVYLTGATWLPSTLQVCHCEMPVGWWTAVLGKSINSLCAAAQSVQPPFESVELSAWFSLWLWARTRFTSRPSSSSNRALTIWNYLLDSFATVRCPLEGWVRWLTGDNRYKGCWSGIQLSLWLS